MSFHDPIKMANFTQYLIDTNYDSFKAKEEYLYLIVKATLNATQFAFETVAYNVSQSSNDWISGQIVGVNNEVDWMNSQIVNPDGTLSESNDALSFGLAGFTQNVAAINFSDPDAVNQLINGTITESDKDEPNIPLIIGLTFGIIGFLLLVGVFVYFMIKRMNK